MGCSGLSLVADGMRGGGGRQPVLNLPAELLGLVLAHLELPDLCAVSSLDPACYGAANWELRRRGWLLYRPPQLEVQPLTATRRLCIATPHLPTPPPDSLLTGKDRLTNCTTHPRQHPAARGPTSRASFLTIFKQDRKQNNLSSFN